ncbi:MAG: hypothetical protein NWF07_10360 [Candidatus Bathyarchaeota archaeon]|nr:hypothetical protein [Candidatus Bathyarchaeota archaeon]
MNLKSLGLLIIAAALLIPTASANIVAENYEIQDITVTAEGQVVPNYGYWVFGEVLNDGGINIQDVVVEVTTYDQSDGLLDTLTVTMAPTIIDAGTKAPFFVKSTVPNQVYDVRVRIQSYKETEFSSFPYIEISNVSPVSEGKITGTVTNTHPNISIDNVEIIATFYDYQGFIDNIQTYGVNENGVLEAGASEDFTIQSELWTPYTASLIPNCDLYLRTPMLMLNITNKNPVIDENLRIDFDVYPKLPDSIITVTFYPPSGGAFPHNAHLYLDGTYYVNMKPTETGEYRVSMEFLPTLVNESRGYVEGAYIEDTFIAKAAPVITPPTTTGSNTTTTDTGSSTDTTTDTSTDTSSDSITEQITKQIPGYPVVSIILGLGVLSMFYRRRL